MDRTRRRVFRSWIISYLTVLLLPLLLSYALYHGAYSIIEQKTAQINEIALRQTGESVERIFGELWSTGLQIIADEKAVSLLFSDKPLSPVKLQRIGQLQRELAKKSAFGSYISESYVYFHRPGVAASTRGIYKNGDFDRMLERDLGIDFDEFAALPPVRGDRVTVRLLEGSEEGRAARVAVLVSDAVTIERPRVTCIFLMRAETIQEILGGYSIESGADAQSVWMIDGAGRFLSSGGYGELPQQVLARSKSPDGTYSDGTGQHKSVMGVATSAMTGIKLVSVISLESYTAQLNHIRNVYLAFLALCLVAGALVSVWFTQRNYTPLERITGLFYARLKPEGGPGQTDEYALLESGLKSLLKKNQDFELQVDRQKRELRWFRLGQMLRGEIRDPESFREVCSDYGIQFPNRSFALIGVLLLDVDQALAHRPEEEEDAILVTELVAASIFEELTRDWNGHACVDGGTLFVVLNPSGEAVMDLPRWEESLRDTCVKSVDFARQRLGICLQCYVSGIYHGPEGIHRGWEETTWGLECLEGVGAPDRPLVWSRTNLPEPPMLDTATQSARMDELTALVKLPEPESAMAVFEALLSERTASLDRSFLSSQLSAFALLGDLCREVLGSDAPLPDPVALQLKQSRSMEELRRNTYDCFQLLHQLSRPPAREPEETTLPQRIAARIDVDYSDPDLSVASLAEDFSISQSYLLRVFKREYHMGVLDYITKKRVEQARRLLHETGDTIQTIAQAVGYTNSLALTRSFKKLEGITPATYRKLL